MVQRSFLSHPIYVFICSYGSGFSAFRFKDCCIVPADSDTLPSWQVCGCSTTGTQRWVSIHQMVSTMHERKQIVRKQVFHAVEKIHNAWQFAYMVNPMHHNLAPCPHIVITFHGYSVFQFDFAFCFSTLLLDAGCMLVVDASVTYTKYILFPGLYCPPLLFYISGS